MRIICTNTTNFVSFITNSHWYYLSEMYVSSSFILVLLAALVKCNKYSHKNFLMIW